MLDHDFFYAKQRVMKMKDTVSVPIFDNHKRISLQIKEIVLNGKMMSDISWVDNKKHVWENLETLILNSNHIKNIGYLANVVFPELKTLSLMDNNIYDIKFLDGFQMPKLKVLNLMVNWIGYKFDGTLKIASEQEILSFMPKRALKEIFPDLEQVYTCNNRILLENYVDCSNACTNMIDNNWLQESEYFYSKNENFDLNVYIPQKQLEEKVA